MDADEQKHFVGEIVDAALPNGGGETFIIHGTGESSFAPKAATRSDDSSGQEMKEETISRNVVDRLANYGGVAKMAMTFQTADGSEYRITGHDESTVKGELLSKPKCRRVAHKIWQTSA